MRWAGDHGWYGNISRIEGEASGIVAELTISLRRRSRGRMYRHHSSRRIRLALPVLVPSQNRDEPFKKRDMKRFFYKLYIGIAYTFITMASLMLWVGVPIGLYNYTKHGYFFSSPKEPSSLQLVSSSHWQGKKGQSGGATSGADGSATNAGNCRAPSPRSSSRSVAPSSSAQRPSAIDRSAHGASAATSFICPWSGRMIHHPDQQLIAPYYQDYYRPLLE